MCPTITLLSCLLSQTYLLNPAPGPHRSHPHHSPSKACHLPLGTAACRSLGWHLKVNTSKALL